MKKSFMVASSLFCLLSLLGFVGIVSEAMAAAEAGWAVKWDKLVEAAKKEGALSLYNTAWP